MRRAARIRKSLSAAKRGVGVERSGDETSGNDKRREIKTAAQCLSHLCLSEHLSDISFTFSSDKSVKLPAHKFVLSMRSAVFEAMFYGSLSEGGKTVSIEDVEPEIIKVVLQYIYSDNPKINGNNVLPCLYTANKYELADLVQQCSDYLENNIDESNVCPIHEQAVMYEMKPLQEKCLSFIIENATTVLSSPDFLKLSHATLLRILEKDELACDEIEIFQAAIRWAESNKKSNVEQSLRDHLGEAVFEIRFPLIPIEKFARVVTPSGILTNEELVMLYRYNATNGSTPIGKFRKQERSEAPVTVGISKNASDQFYGNSSGGCFLTLGYNNSLSVFDTASVQCSCQKLKPRNKSIKIKSVAGTFVERLKRIKVSGTDPSDYQVKGNKVIFMNPIDITDNATIEFMFDDGNGFNTGIDDDVSPGYPNHKTNNTNQHENIKGHVIIISRIPEGLESIIFA